MQVEALPGSHDHILDDTGLGLADRRRRLDIDDDGIVEVDEIVRRIGEEGPVAVCSGVTGRRIGRRKRLGFNRRGCPECRIVQRVQIFLRGSGDRFRN